jgi:hypothetical protein
MSNTAILESVNAKSLMHKVSARLNPRFAQGNSIQSVVATARPMVMHVRQLQQGFPLITRVNVSQQSLKRVVVLRQSNVRKTRLALMIRVIAATPLKEEQTAQGYAQPSRTRWEMFEFVCVINRIIMIC